MNRKTILLNFVLPFTMVGLLAFSWVYFMNEEKLMELYEAETVVSNLSMMDIEDISCLSATMNIAKLPYETFTGADIILEKWQEIYDEKNCQDEKLDFESVPSGTVVIEGLD